MSTHRWFDDKNSIITQYKRHPDYYSRLENRQVPPKGSNTGSKYIKDTVLTSLVFKELVK